VSENIWPPILACIVILLIMGHCSAHANDKCRVGADGNIYSSETAYDIFVDPDNHDFRLKPGSCAVDRGATIPEVTHDFDGVKRPKGKAYDIGAFELIPSRPNAPDGLRISKGGELMQ
jgi:hypothetical protein